MYTNYPLIHQTEIVWKQVVNGEYKGELDSEDVAGQNQTYITYMSTTRK